MPGSNAHAARTCTTNMQDETAPANGGRQAIRSDLPVQPDTAEPKAQNRSSIIASYFSHKIVPVKQGTCCMN